MDQIKSGMWAMRGVAARQPECVRCVAWPRGQPECVRCVVWPHVAARMRGMRNVAARQPECMRCVAGPRTAAKDAGSDYICRPESQDREVHMGRRARTEWFISDGKSGYERMTETGLSIFIVFSVTRQS